jgi:opacity protein-like surface antigen
MIRLLKFNFILPILLQSHFSFGQVSTNNFDARVAELKVLSRSHENLVATLLAQPSIPKTNFVIPPSIPDRQNYTSEPDSIPSNIEYTEPSLSSPVSEQINDPSNEVEFPVVTEGNDINKAYEELYFSAVPTRAEGYYFGPLVGLTFPQNGAVRNRSGTTFSKNEYDADAGFLLGMQIGRDFGTVRAEADYSYQNFDASGDYSLSASIHSFLGRLILEKEFGDQFDLRLGLGMGVGMVNLDSTTEISGTGFAYDFLVGCSYRLLDHLSLQLDYRYYLSAANDEYDHMKSHIWLFSVGFDL